LARRRQRLDEFLGPWPGKVPADVEILETVPGDGYVRHKVVFDSEATMSVPAYLLEPQGSTSAGPGLLVIHGHGGGKAEVCSLSTPGSPAPGYAIELARRGYLVLVPDLRCFGERADEVPAGYCLCDTNLVHAYLAGRNPFAENLWDLKCSLDVLGAHPGVTTMGVVGRSDGGALAMFLAAADQRVQAAVVGGFVAHGADVAADPPSTCGSLVVPGLTGPLDQADLAALVAPRPLLVLTRAKEEPALVAATVSALRTAYGAWGVGDKVSHEVVGAGHRWPGDATYAFLERSLWP
jgi:dienelactone hydrolase